MPEWLCHWDCACACSFSQYLSAMKVSVGVNLLVGVWIWLYQQSDLLSTRVNKVVRGTVNLVEEKQQGGARSIKSDVKRIVDNAESACRTATMHAVIAAGICTFVILLIGFFVKHDEPVCGGWWWGALILALGGPAAMAVAWLRIVYLSSKAVTDTNTTIHEATSKLSDQKPDSVPVDSVREHSGHDGPSVPPSPKN